MSRLKPDNKELIQFLPGQDAGAVPAVTIDPPYAQVIHQRFIYSISIVDSFHFMRWLELRIWIKFFIIFNGV